MVSRIACNSGVTGEVLAPDVQIRDSDVVVTFTVQPENAGPYEVRLNEPIGNRPLIDGQCLPGGEALDTSLCIHPARWTP